MFLEPSEYKMHSCNSSADAGMSSSQLKSAEEYKNEIENLLKEALKIKGKIEEQAIAAAETAFNDEERYTEVYKKFLAKLAVGDTENAFEYFCDAVENGYNGDYSIIPSYFMIGYDGVGGGEYEKAFIWTKRFYEEYLAGSLNVDENFEFDQALHEYNLGVLNFMFNDSIGSEEEGVECWNKCVEHRETATENLATIAISMLGANLQIYNTTISVDCNMQLAMSALKKDAALGNVKARQVLAHIRRDGYDVNDLDAFLQQLDNNENVYTLGVCFIYGYGVLQSDDNAKDWLEDVFGFLFSYDEYLQKHSLMKTDIDIAFEENVYSKVLDDSWIHVHLCGINFDSDELALVFWVWNNSEFDIKVVVNNIEVNGDFYDHSNLIGGIQGYSSSCMTQNIRSTGGIYHSSIENIELFIRIAVEETGEIRMSKKVTIDCDTVSKIFSTKVKK